MNRRNECKHALEFIEYSIDRAIDMVNASNNYTTKEKKMLFKLKQEITIEIKKYKGLI